MTDDAPQSYTLTHAMPWDLRLVTVAGGCAAMALPFLVGEGELSSLQSAAFVVGGLAFALMFIFANATSLTVDREGVTLRQGGLFGRKVERLPLSEIVSADVMMISTRGSTSYNTAVKLKGRRRTFMGESHGEQADAEQEVALFRRLAGMAAENNL